MKVAKIKYFLTVFLVFICGTAPFYSQTSIIIKGKILEPEKKKPLSNISISMMNSTLGTTSDKNGKFELKLPALSHISLLFKGLGYKNEIKELDFSTNESEKEILIMMKTDSVSLEGVNVYAKAKPDTIFGTPKYSIADFNFYEDKFILLTFTKNMEHTFIRLINETKKEISSTEVPMEGGEAKELHQDYMGFTNIICKDSIYRIIIKNEKIILYPLPVKDFNALLKPVIDTIQHHLYFSNYSSDFPMFNYYQFDKKDSTYYSFTSIENKELMDLYRFEYYFLKPNEKLMARQLADEYKIDKHKAAAMMTGFTKSMYYTPLYAPLFVISDTIHVFDHYKNLLFHFNSSGKKLDSVNISYHHPKKWNDWKNHMVKDITEGNVFAIYSRDGRKYMKKINIKSGQDEGNYRIIHYSADRIKVRDNYIYYVYRPYESTQEKFLYREKIILKN